MFSFCQQQLRLIENRSKIDLHRWIDGSIFGLGPIATQEALYCRKSDFLMLNRFSIVKLQFFFFVWVFCHQVRERDLPMVMHTLSSEFTLFRVVNGETVAAHNLGVTNGFVKPKLGRCSSPAGKLFLHDVESSWWEINDRCRVVSQTITHLRRVKTNLCI